MTDNKNIRKSNMVNAEDINQPEITWAVSKSLLIAADGTKVRSAAL
jgi:hypothetical protein